MTVKQILIENRYEEYGYLEREELIDGSEWGCNDFTVQSAYTLDGDRIGDWDNAKYICVEMGIKPEKRTEHSNVCSIGFSEKTQEWYGWSHRGMCSFGIGSKVEKYDCGYKPDNSENLLDSLIKFWVDTELWQHNDKGRYRNLLLRANKDTTDPHGETDGIGCYVAYYTEFDYKREQIHHIHFKPYPEEWGKGEWTAKTLDDAKQMAMDYAEGVS